MKPLQRLDSPAVVAALVALLYTTFVLLLLDVRGNDISIFVVAGGPGVDPTRTPPGLTVIPGIGGYDGASFYRFALDPFTNVETAYGIKLDNPAYRQQRIGYPMLVWFLSAGRPRLVPFLLVAVNVAALVVIGILGAMLARRFGRHALWGFAVAMYPGFLLTLSRDTSEIVAVAFALAGMVALVGQRPLLGAAMLSCAVLTRETTMLMVGALVFSGAIDVSRNRRNAGNLIAGLIPAAVYGIWQLFLGARWDVLPLLAARIAIAPPFQEYWRFVLANLPRRIHLQRLYFDEALFLAVLMVASVTSMWRSESPRWWRIAWGLNLAMAASLGPVFWVEDFSFFRVFAELYLMSAVLILVAGRTVRTVTLLATLAMWGYLAQHLIDVG